MHKKIPFLLKQNFLFIVLVVFAYSRFATAEPLIQEGSYIAMLKCGGRYLSPLREQLEREEGLRLSDDETIKKLTSRAKQWSYAQASRIEMSLKEYDPNNREAKRRGCFIHCAIDWRKGIQLINEAFKLPTRVGDCEVIVLVGYYNLGSDAKGWIGNQDELKKISQTDLNILNLLESNVPGKILKVVLKDLPTNLSPKAKSEYLRSVGIHSFSHILPPEFHTADPLEFEFETCSWWDDYRPEECKLLEETSYFEPEFSTKIPVKFWLNGFIREFRLAWVNLEILQGFYKSAIVPIAQGDPMSKYARVEGWVEYSFYGKLLGDHREVERLW